MSRKIDAMYERFGRHDGKCIDCGNLECYVYNKRYYKCAVYGVSRSTATDWRLSWDACGMYNTLWTGRQILDLIKHESKREPILPPEGQLELDNQFPLEQHRPSSGRYTVAKKLLTALIVEVKTSSECVRRESRYHWSVKARKNRRDNDE